MGENNADKRVTDVAHLDVRRKMRGKEYPYKNEGKPSVISYSVRGGEIISEPEVSSLPSKSEDLGDK